MEPLKEVSFYLGYRKRLEAKFIEKEKQITRDEHLLETSSGGEGQSLHASLRRTTAERDELKLLLDQVYQQLEKLGGSQ
ncbi:MAG: hypothetical protein FIB03_20880 [Anaerolineae bacterium]|nr:hypothetical protein [Anaerolineae bacterium]